MPISTTMLQSDLDFMITDLPTSVTANGETHNCVVGDITSGDEVEIAGILDSNDFVVFISLDDWTSAPVEGQRVTISGTNYRVSTISDAPDGISRQLNCVGDVQ